MDPEIKEPAGTDSQSDMHHDHEHHSHENNDHEHHGHHSMHHAQQEAATTVKKPIYQNTYVKVFAVYLLISLVMFWTITINITTTITNGYGDVHQSLFNLWWFPYSLLVLHQNPYFTQLLYYPVGANLATQTLSPIAAILIAPIYDLSAALAYNVLFFLGYSLSGLFMFMLARYVTKNNYASFIAGLIFAFSPVHVAQSVAHLDWTMVQWIPAFILFYMMALREKKIIYAILAAASFVLLTFMGDIQQGLLTFTAAIVLTALLVVIERKDMLNIQTAKVFGAFVLFTLILSSPILALLIPQLSSGAFSVAQQNSAISSNMQWSDNLESFFLPSYYNGIFNGAAQSYLYIYQLTYQGVQYTINVGERVSYIGYSVLILALIGVYADYKKNKLKNSLIWVVLLIFFGWLSLGPYLQVGQDVTSIPGIYLLFRDIPLLNIIREPGRMDFIVALCLAIIAAIGFERLIQGKDRKTSYQYLAIVSLLILIEYNGMPLTSSYINSSAVSVTIPNVYYQIHNVSGNFSVLMLPAISNASSTPNEFTGTETYYVTATKKPLIGGYTSRENATQSSVISSIPLAAAASYLEQGYGLIYPSPITQDPANVTLLFFAVYHTAFVTVLRSAYSLPEQSALYAYLNSSFGAPVAYSNTTLVFSTNKAITQDAERSLVAYTPQDQWIPGYDFCSSIGPCDANISSLWWGNNTRGVELFSPADENIHMSMIAASPVNGTVLQIYLNGEPPENIALRSSQYQYIVNMTVPQGISQILFYTQNSTSQISPYFGYGIRNITFTKAV